MANNKQDPLEKGTIHNQDRTQWDGIRLHQLLREVCDLKLMNCLLLEFSIYCVLDCSWVTAESETTGKRDYCVSRISPLTLSVFIEYPLMVNNTIIDVTIFKA